VTPPSRRQTAQLNAPSGAAKAEQNALGCPGWRLVDPCNPLACPATSPAVTRAFRTCSKTAQGPERLRTDSQGCRAGLPLRGYPKIAGAGFHDSIIGCGTGASASRACVALRRAGPACSASPRGWPTAEAAVPHLMPPRRVFRTGSGAGCRPEPGHGQGNPCPTLPPIGNGFCCRPFADRRASVGRRDTVDVRACQRRTQDRLRRLSHFHLLPSTAPAATQRLFRIAAQTQGRARV
jgi:hypothetical protein